MPAINENTKHSILFVLMPIFVMWLVLLAMLAFRDTDFSPSPIRYSQSVYQPTNSPPHCAGDAIEYSPRLTVLEDADLVVTRAIRRDNTNEVTGLTG